MSLTNNTLGDLAFKAEDFIDENNRASVEKLAAVFGFDAVKECEKLAALSARIANRLLAERLEKAPLVVGNNLGTSNAYWETGVDGTHTARLVCIVPITELPKEKK